MRSLALIVTLLGTTASASAGTYAPLTGFGSNPGGLEMFSYVPTGAPRNAPLVVMMHGCSQTAMDATKVGWNALADRHGFYVLYPQQTSGNNPVKCFNWAGEYGDTANLTRGMGENESLHQAVMKMIADQGIDARRVFVAGFSAGGAMSAVMMSTWPELFAAGAVWSGLPYRCATTVNGAYNCQSLASHPELKKTPGEWGDLVRAAHPGFAGPWPRVVLVHGTSDGIVSYDNETELIEQWTNVHGVDQTADATAMVGAHTREQHLKAGVPVVEVWRMASMGHAVAMGADPDGACPPMGGSYIEERGLCAAYRTGVFFGIVGPGPSGGDGGIVISPDGGVAGADGGVGTPDGAVSQPGAAVVAITSPGANATVSGAVTITATASDADGVARVEFFVDGVLKGSDGTAPYTQLWQTAYAEPGMHELKAVAFDSYESSASVRVTVTVAAEGDGPGADDQPEVDPISFGCAVGGGGGAGACVIAAIAMASVLGLLMVRRRR